MLPHTIVLEPLSECFLLGFFAAWSVSFLFKVDPFAVYLFHILLWFLLDYVLLCIIQVRPAANRRQCAAVIRFISPCPFCPFLQKLILPDFPRLYRFHPQSGTLPFSKTEYVIAWFFRELVALVWYVKALHDPEIRWRTGCYKLKWGGVAEEVKSKL